MENEIKEILRQFVPGEYALSIATKSIMNIVNKHAAKELGSVGGKVKSEAKIKAARENGKKGGRPKNIKKY